MMKYDMEVWKESGIWKGEMKKGKERGKGKGERKGEMKGGKNKMKGNTDVRMKKLNNQRMEWDIELKKYWYKRKKERMRMKVWGWKDDN